jgi:hypothetical protein
MKRIRSIWNQGRAAIIDWLSIPTALSAEALARSGYDGLLVSGIVLATLIMLVLLPLALRRLSRSEVAA